MDYVRVRQALARKQVILYDVTIFHINAMIVLYTAQGLICNSKPPPSLSRYYMQVYNTKTYCGFTSDIIISTARCVQPFEYK